MNTNPKKNPHARRKRPTYGHNSYGRSTRTDGASVIRVKGGGNRSKYTP